MVTLAVFVHALVSDLCGLELSGHLLMMAATLVPVETLQDYQRTLRVHIAEAIRLRWQCTPEQGTYMPCGVMVPCEYLYTRLIGVYSTAIEMCDDRLTVDQFTCLTNTLYCPMAIYVNWMPDLCATVEPWKFG